MPRHFRGHAAEEKAPDCAETLCTHDDQVRLFLFGDRDDLVGRRGASKGNPTLSHADTAAAYGQTLTEHLARIETDRAFHSLQSCIILTTDLLFHLARFSIIPNGSRLILIHPATVLVHRPKIVTTYRHFC